jgi:parallel beta-helix repeat protein
VIGNTGKGIVLKGSGHRIEGCTAYDNDVGISCSDSLLIHNVSTGNAAVNVSGTGNTLVDNHF